MKIIIYIFLFSSIQIAIASEIKTITYATPEWKNITNSNGTGLYHEILQKVFKPEGIKIKVKYVPLKRAVFMANNHDVDIVGGLTESAYKNRLLFSNRAIYHATISVLMNKKHLKNWVGMETIKKTPSLIVIPPLIAKGFGINGNVINLKREQCVKMLSIDRAHYYIDVKSVLEGIVRSFKSSYKSELVGIEGQNINMSKIKINIDEFQIVELFDHLYHMAFPISKRGRALKTVYDKGIERLYLSGELESIYKKWGLENALDMSTVRSNY